MARKSQIYTWICLRLCHASSQLLLRNFEPIRRHTYAVSVYALHEDITTHTPHNIHTYMRPITSTYYSYYRCVFVSYARFFFLLIPFIIFAHLLLTLLPTRKTQIRGHIAGSSTPFPLRYVEFNFNSRKSNEWVSVRETWTHDIELSWPANHLRSSKPPGAPEYSGVLFFPRGGHI